MDLDFDPTIPADVRTDLTKAAQNAGLPLWQLELLGQDESVARGVASAHRAGRLDVYLTACDWERLERLYEARREAQAAGFWTRRSIGVGVPEVLPMMWGLPGVADRNRNGQ